MNWLVDALITFVTTLAEEIIRTLSDAGGKYLEDLLSAIVGVPTPRSDSTWLVFEDAHNPPWDSLLPEIYWEFVVPLAWGLQFLSLAYLGLRYSSLSPARRKRDIGRLMLAFLSTFFWLPIASAAGQLFDAIGHAILTEGLPRSEIISWATESVLVAISSDGGFLLIIALIMVYVFFKSVFLFAGRYIGLILITLLMPLVLTFWSITIWPLNQFESLARQATGTYTALLISGIPPAFLLRIGAQVGFEIPTRLSWLVFLVTLWGAAKSQKWLVQRGAPKLVELSEQARSHAAKPVRGAVDATWTAATIGGYATAGGIGGAAVSGARSAVGSGSTPYGVHQVHRQLSKTRSDRNPSGSSSGGGVTSKNEAATSSSVQNSSTRLVPGRGTHNAVQNASNRIPNSASQARGQYSGAGRGTKQSSSGSSDSVNTVRHTRVYSPPDKSPERDEPSKLSALFNDDISLDELKENDHPGPEDQADGYSGEQSDEQAGINQQRDTEENDE